MQRDALEPPVLPYARREQREFTPPLTAALMLAWVYPLLPLGALYATWAAAWITLGHKPRGGPDDPGSISFAVTVLGAVAGLLLITVPVGGLMGVGAGMIFTPWWVYCRGGGVATSGILVLILLAWYAAASAFLLTDPFRVMYWFMD